MRAIPRFLAPSILKSSQRGKFAPEPFIGNKKVDLFKASSLKCLYLCPMWTDNIDEESEKYGIHIKDLRHLIKVIQILINQNAFYYKLKINNMSTVYALTRANNFFPQQMKIVLLMHLDQH
ncbi:hypothetical protein FAM18149p_13555 (plasmid) [Lacticaseibacillus paracasei]|nr:hypothetical protein FAM18149p_13555 [Lacticaseibacillus paracasei]